MTQEHCQIENDKDNSNVMYNLGRCCYLGNDYEQMKKYYQLAIDAGNSNAGNYYAGNYNADNSNAGNLDAMY